jgi:hypothetical protein
VFFCLILCVSCTHHLKCYYKTGPGFCALALCEQLHCAGVNSQRRRKTASGSTPIFTTPHFGPTIHSLDQNYFFSLFGMVTGFIGASHCSHSCQRRVLEGALGGGQQILRPLCCGIQWQPIGAAARMLRRSFRGCGSRSSGSRGAQTPGRGQDLDTRVHFGQGGHLSSSPRVWCVASE